MARFESTYVAEHVAGAFPMTDTARDELRDALARRAAAEGALESARQASARGRALLEAITRQVDDLQAASMSASSSLAAEMKAAIASGGTPSVANNHEPAKNVASRADLDARRQAAEQVVADLAAEEREGERAVSNVVAAVERAVHDVLRGEAEKIAASWEEVELKARAIRIRLGGRSGFDPIPRVSGLSNRVGRALYQNREDREFDSPQSEIARGPWTDFAAALLGDSDAELDFAAADRAIAEMTKEREERRAADDRFIARMRGEAA
jgi:hypothetical protein